MVASCVMLRCANCVGVRCGFGVELAILARCQRKTFGLRGIGPLVRKESGSQKEREFLLFSCYTNPPQKKGYQLHTYVQTTITGQ